MRAHQQRVFVNRLLNSSTITTVLMVGFVSPGLMSLNQTVPMIMGANVGSTTTAQIIAFNLSALTPVILVVGFLLRALGRRETFRHLGGLILGFGLLFSGHRVHGRRRSSLSDASAVFRYYAGYA
jgi:phosphate:Na+ symporter